MNFVVKSLMINFWRQSTKFILSSIFGFVVQTPTKLKIIHSLQVIGRNTKRDAPMQSQFVCAAVAAYFISLVLLTRCRNRLESIRNIHTTDFNVVELFNCFQCVRRCCRHPIGSMKKCLKIVCCLFFVVDFFTKNILLLQKHWILNSFDWLK